jgi:release factor glutamine methyltransferase
VSRPADLVTDAAATLAGAGVESPTNDAEILLAHVLGVSRGALALAGNVGPDERSRYAVLVARRAERVPLQHLTGSTGFRYVEIEVGPGVFTPRPETELVAGWAIEAARRAEHENRTCRVVDLCTGSGAIALAVATEVPTADVHAVELDPEAFAWAQRNLDGSGVDLREGDMAEAFPDLDGTVDVVVCNPPYIPLTAYDGVAPEARDHDPALALWSGQDGLEAMRVLERVAARLLRVGGQVGAEHADLQGESAPAVFVAAGRWADVRDHDDLAGRPRYLTARRAR